MKKFTNLLVLLTLIILTSCTSIAAVGDNSVSIPVELKDISAIKRPSTEIKPEDLTVPEFYYGTEDLIYGDFGSIKVGSYNVGLYGDERRYNTTLDKYIDLDEAAPVYTLYQGTRYIPDHNYQGFTEIFDNDELYIYDTKGFPTKYRKVSTHECYSLNYDWMTTDGICMWDDDLGVDLITQTCIPNGVAFVLWEIVE